MKSALAFLGFKCLDLGINTGYLLDAKGKRVLDSRGEPVAVIFDPGMIRNLDTFERKYYAEAQAPYYPPPDLKRWVSAYQAAQKSFGTEGMAKMR